MEHTHEHRHGHEHGGDGHAGDAGRPDGEGMHPMDAEFWDDRYQSAPALWSGEPNPHLVAELADLDPGTALEVGAGEGADAIWLAERGWLVTAVDISAVALERGRAQAEVVGGRIPESITWLQADLTEWAPPGSAFDLVSVHFIHLPSDQRRPVYAGLAEAVAPGGVLLVVGHHPSDLETSVMRPPDPDALFAPEELAAELGDGWSILVQDTRPRSAVDADGEDVTVHDSVLVARRNPQP